jgi:hypothetical protein
MTVDLRKAIEKAFSQFKIFDADFAERFYAWKDNKAQVEPKKTAKERMNERVAAMLARNAKHDVNESALDTPIEGSDKQ